MRKITILALTVAAVAVTTSASGDESTSILQTVLAEFTRGDDVVVLALETAAPVAILEEFEDRKGGVRTDELTVAPPLWQDFKQRNSQPVRLKVVPGVRGVLMLSAAEVNILLPSYSEASWKAFREMWPRVSAFVRVSRISVSRDKRTALIYVSVTRAPLNAEGTLILLENDSGVWIVKQRRVMVAS